MPDRCDHVVAGADDVLLPEDQWIHAQASRDLVHGGLDGEGDLAKSVAPERSGGSGVGIDGVGVDLLVRGAVDGEGLADAVEHDAGAVVPVRAGVGDHPHLDRGERAVGAGAELDPDGERVAGGGAVELLGAGVFELDRAAQLECGQDGDVLGQHLLLAAEAAAHPAGDDADLVLGKAVEGAQRTAGQERGLRAGAHGQPLPAAVLLRLEVGDAAVGFEAGVLHALGLEGLLVHDRCFGESVVHAADLAVHLTGHVVLDAGDPLLRTLARRG